MEGTGYKSVCSLIWPGLGKMKFPKVVSSSKYNRKIPKYKIDKL